MRIGTRLAFALAPPVVLLLLTAATALWRLDSLNGEFTRIVVERQGKADLLGAIILENQALLGAAQATLLAADAAQAAPELARIGAAKKVLDALLERLDRAFRDEPAGPRALLQAVHTRHSAYLVDLVRFTRLVESGRGEDARDLLNTRLKAKLGAALAAMRELAAVQTAAMQASVAAAAESYRDARDLTFALAALSVALAALVAAASARAISRPLVLAVQVAQRVAAGDLTSAAEASGCREARQLIDALGSMNASLARIVRDVRASSDTIAHASERLVGANGELSARTVGQAASLQQAAGAMEEFTAAAASNAGGASRAAALAAEATDVATRGEQAVGRMVATMGSISASSRRIGDIVGFIDRVSFQTHLLALNAAVEAARAGAEGRGFAVIALEVRDLAARSAAAARDVRLLVQGASAEIAQGAELAGEAGRTMREMLEAARAVAGIMADISAASQEQRAGIEQVNAMLSGMDLATQGNAGLVRDVAASMRELQDEARRLVDLVRVFELGDAAPGRAAIVEGRVLPRLAPAHAWRS